LKLKEFLFLIFLFGCMGYNSTIERANLSNSLFLNGFYGRSVGKAQTPSGSKEFLEFLFNFGFEKKIFDNVSLNVNFTSQNQFQNFENFTDTLNYLRINFGIKNKLFNNFSIKPELIYDIDLNIRPFRPYNQKYLYGILKFIYDYKNFSFITSLNSLSIVYSKSFFQSAFSLYLRPDYNTLIFNFGLGFRK